MSSRVEQDRFIARPEWRFAKTEAEFDPRGEPLVELAWEVAKIAHRHQERNTGEPYINHIVAVASIVRDVFGISDPETVASSILHDVVEDCEDISEEQLGEISELVGRRVDKLDLRFISETFGKKTAFWVDGVTKLGTDFETVRKLLLHAFVDPVGAIDKLADRLHNMSTLGDMEREKQMSKSLETMHVYTHLAESLGIWVVKNKLEDMAFFYLNPEKYLEVQRAIDSDPRLNTDFIERMIAEWNDWLEIQQLDGRIEVRVKGYWEANKKRDRLIEEGRCLDKDGFRDVADLVSFRIIVKDLDEADVILGRLSRQYKDIIDIERSDNFITEPADNGYSAYHLTMNIGGQLIEVAITTEDREEYNNWGVVSVLRKGEAQVADYARIMVFSPNDELHFLPQGATGIDYARAISPRLLAQAVGMIIDDSGVIVDIREKVPNAARVYIVTDSQRDAADPEWQNYCVTRAAKSEIARQQELKVKKETMNNGKLMLESVLNERGLFNLEDLSEKTFDQIRYSLDVGGRIGDIYTKIGAGMLGLERVRENLDAAGVFKDHNGVRVTSIRIDGPDIEGTMAQLTNWIAEFGGSLSFSTNRAQEGGYSARLVIRGLSVESEQELKVLMQNDEMGRFTGVDLV